MQSDKVLCKIYKAATKQASSRVEQMCFLDEYRSHNTTASSLFDAGMKLCDPTSKKRSILATMGTGAAEIKRQEKNTKRGSGNRKKMWRQWSTRVSELKQKVALQQMRIPQSEVQHNAGNP